jgi:hypothetical protein
MMSYFYTFAVIKTTMGSRRDSNKYDPTNNHHIFPLNSHTHENNHWHQLARRIPKMPKNIGKFIDPNKKVPKRNKEYPIVSEHNITNKIQILQNAEQI